MAMTVLCINAGSSSLKCALFAEGPRALARVAIDRVTDHVAAVDDALARLDATPALVAHRIVHGGSEHVAPCMIDDGVVASLARLVPLAPLHQPASLAGIAAVRARLPGVRQIACFDTAFHAQLPDVARTLPIAAEGVRRYGFHGLSYEYVLSVLDPVPPRLVIAHLGSGASLVAVERGRSIDTTMGMTPDGGIPMGTRTGDLDPGVLLYLLRERSIDDVARLVERDGGLRALAGTADMRELLARDDAAARLAIDMFAYAIKKAIGAYAAALGGLDLLVFTGGIGEHAARVRDLACSGLEFLGARIQVIPTDEDLVMARHAFALAR